MRSTAIVMREYGGPDVLRMEEVDLPAPAAGDVRIQVLASAVNHSDLEIRAGTWPVRRDPAFPYVPGLETVGEVVQIGDGVASVAVGENVVTMMQGLGGIRAERAGGYAEHVTVPADAVAIVPADVDPLAIAALGLAAVTAYEGMRRIGPLAGRRVVVTGASGGVGSAGVVLACALDAAEVIGVVRRRETADYVRSLGAHQVVVSSETSVVDAVGARSVDRVLDTVGGETFGQCVDTLRAGGGLSLVGAVSGGNVAFDVWPLLQPVSLTGYGSETLDGQVLRAAMTTICSLLAVDELAVPGFTQFPLADAARAHELLESHTTEGRVVLIPS